MRDKKKIGLGTVQFGMAYGISNKSGQTEPHEVEKILNLAKQEGIQVLDSASGYGNAEEVLGRNDLSEFRIVSKYLPPTEGEKIEVQLNSTLQNLRTGKLYGYLAHRPMDLLNHPEQWEELQRIRQQGRVDKIGFSLNEPSELDELLNRGFNPDLIQVPYNLFDRRFESMMKELNKSGCEIHTRSTFLQGLFFMDPFKLDHFFKEIEEILIHLQKNRKELAGQLLIFSLEKPFIDNVIIGTETAEQLEENLKMSPSNSLPNIQYTVSDNILIPSRWPKK